MNHPLIITFSILIHILSLEAQQFPKLPTAIGIVNISFPGYLEIFRHVGNPDVPVEDTLVLFISTFDAYAFLQKDAKYIVRSPGRYFKNVTDFSLHMELLDKTAYWPNSPDVLPQIVLGSQGVIWSSGFLVPGKQQGMLEIYNTSHFPYPDPVNIASLDTVNWYYHRTLWKDMDLDGDVDAVVCRFRTANAQNPLRSELVWFENPNQGFVSGWKQHVLVVDGPDVHIRLVIIGRYECILAAEFWNRKLVLYCAMYADWMNNNITRVVIDEMVGQPFDCNVEDLNRDGKKEFVVTAYNTTIQEGYVKVYKIPENFPNEAFAPPIIIASGFYANEIIAGDSMSPGGMKTFYPSKDAENTIIGGRQLKPYLILSGDDDGKHYILVPSSQEVENWEYEKFVLVDTEKTTSGKFAVEDIDGDGYTDIIVAGYTANSLYIFSYAP